MMKIIDEQEAAFFEWLGRERQPQSILWFRGSLGRPVGFNQQLPTLFRGRAELEELARVSSQRNRPGSSGHFPEFYSTFLESVGLFSSFSELGSKAPERVRSPKPEIRRKL